MDFYSLYNSFEEFFDSFYRGNEVEFIYNNEQFFILPIYSNEQNVVGVRFGKSYCDIEQLCFSKEDLFNVRISQDSFGGIVDQIKIIWHNF